MPRNARKHLQHSCFHVLNRGNHRPALFRNEEDYGLFIELLAEVGKQLWGGIDPMGNHWHLVAGVGEIEVLSRLETDMVFKKILL